MVFAALDSCFRRNDCFVGGILLGTLNKFKLFKLEIVNKNQKKPVMGKWFGE